MTYNELWRQLAHIYDDGEAKAIARMVYEVRFGLSPSDLFIGKDTQLSADDQKVLAEITQRLMAGEPVQYAIGLAEFGGRIFHVGPGVLIPRPETYELCQWIVSSGLQDERTLYSMEKSSSPVVRCKKILEKSSSPVVRCKKILDIGTGSGCIACTLAADMPNAQVTAWDISEEALRTAAANAESIGVTVRFEKRDILNVMPTVLQLPCNEFDAIVSNPPYICEKEKDGMERNVLDYEPALALFVPDDDPLLFYRAIARYGLTGLKPGGSLYFEINPLYADALHDLLSRMSWHDIEIKEDQFGKQRFIKASK